MKKLDKQRRKFLSLGLGAVGVIGGGVAIASYDKRQKTLHDLSVLGDGTPTIVQIHDPACPKCRSLKLRTENIVGKLPDSSIHYRLADVTTAEGKALQSKYRSATVTLLMFDSSGKHVDTIQGVQSAEMIQAAVDRLISSVRKLAL